MGNKSRGYDESTSPQWKYLLGKESAQKRKARRTKENTEKMFSEGIGESSSQPQHKSWRSKREKREGREDASGKQKEQATTKTGKKIVYSASPGGNEGREKWRLPSAPIPYSILDDELKKFRN